MNNNNERIQRIDALEYDYAAQPKEYVRVCNLCESVHFITVAYADRYGFSVPLVLCTGCGLGFLSPRMTAEACAQFYAQVHRRLQSAYWGREVDEETIQTKQRVYAEYVWQLLKPYAKDKPIKTLLDIGGSTGIVAKELQESLKEGWSIKVTVLDPAPLEIAVAERLGFEAQVGLMEDFDSEGRHWDLVILCQTVDHLLDIQCCFDKIRALIAEDGLFFFDIVDWAYMCNKQGKIGDSVKIDHPFYLTRQTALAFARQSGFEVVAEAASPDEHHVGFLCIPTTKGQLDQPALKQHAKETLQNIRMLQARHSEYKFWPERKLDRKAVGRNESV